MSDKPAPVGFNVDTFAPEKHEPFAVVIGGKRYEMVHTEDLDAFGFIDAYTKGEASATNDVLTLALGDDGIKALRALKPTNAVLNELVSRYFAHCGIDTGNSDN